MLLIPGLLLALIAAHMLLLVYHKHTQWPGPGRTEKNVVGYPLLPVYTAKAGGFFFIVFGVTALMGALLPINPVWMYGPYDPSKVTAGSQPDWYMGWLEGALRIMPGWETHICGHHDLAGTSFIPVAVLIGPAVHRSWCCLAVHRGLGHRRQARAPPARPAAQRPDPDRVRWSRMITFYGLLWAAGGNDIIAIEFDLELNQITYFMRVAVFVGPVIAFIITRRWCISLQRADNDRLLHGYETGIIMRSPEGGYSERHLPISDGRGLHPHRPRPRRGLRARVEPRTATASRPPAPAPARSAPGCRAAMFADNVQKPTTEELEEGHHHAEHEHELQAGLDHPADGHQFDGHHAVEGEELRSALTAEVREEQPDPPEASGGSAHFAGPGVRRRSPRRSSWSTS